MSVQTSTVEMQSAESPVVDMNPGDANPPSRPGRIAMSVFVSALSALLLYMNWKSVKGFLGMD